MTKRKYLAEGGIHLYTSGANIFRPSDLYLFKDNQEIRDALENCNIYIIGRRRRISICPHSLKIVNGLIHGDFRLHKGFDFERFPFSQKLNITRDFEPTPISPIEIFTVNEDGFTLRVIDEKNRPTDVPAYAMVSKSNHKLYENTDIEVLYIGQGYGNDGKLLAIDRLLNHSTLQKILAETAEHCPDDELLLLMFRYEHAKNILSTAGDFSIQPTASDSDEQAYIKKVASYKLDRKSLISLAEAALINYFKPEYNVVHKDSFTSKRKLKTLAKILDADLSALIVEINTSNFGSKIYSKNAPAKNLEDIFSKDQLESIQNSKINHRDRDNYVSEMTHAHIAQFALYSPIERETFLDSMPWFN